MKKFFLVILILTMVFSVVSCGEKEDGPSNMQNPWEIVEKNTLYEKLGYSFNLTEDSAIKNVTYLWSSSLQVGEVQFEYNGTTWVGRAKRGTKLEDISGMNYDIKEEVPFEVSNKINGTLKLYDAGLSLIWADNSYIYSLSGLDTNDVNNLPPLEIMGVVSETEIRVVNKEHNPVYWANKNDISLKTFSILNGSEELKYYFLEGMDLFTWTNSEFNVDKWHYLIDKDGSIYRNAVYSEDDSLMVTNSSMILDGDKYEVDKNFEVLDYTNTTRFGSLIAINSCTIFNSIKGINIMGNMDYSLNHNEESLVDIRYSFSEGEELAIYIYDDDSYENWIGNVNVYAFSGKLDLSLYPERLDDDLKADAKATAEVEIGDGIRVAKLILNEVDDYDLIFAYNDYVTYIVKVIVNQAI